MNSMNVRTYISRYVSIVLLLLLAWSGFTGWWNQWIHSDTIYRQIQSTAQLLFGVLSGVVVILLLLKRSLPIALEGALVLCIFLAGTMAPVVWGRQGIFVGLLAGALSALIAAGTLWLARRGSRSITPNEEQPG